jgi:hypothetical protein
VPVARPCYCNRADVQRAPDLKNGYIDNARVDRALASAADKIEGQLRRMFYPRDFTYRWDWPNYQATYPWQLYLDNWDICVLTALESPQGTSIPLNQAIAYPLNRKPGWPARRIQLDRASTAAWGAASSPQAAIWATGTWGFTVDQDPAGTLAAAVTTTTQTTITGTDGSQAGPGDVLILNPGQSAAPFPQAQYAHTFGATGALTGERVIVQDVAAAATGLTQTGTGLSTPAENDNQLATTGSGALNPGEVIVLDGERMLVTQVTAGIATVIRAWDSTVAAAHSGATVYALRAWTVLRGQLGTTAATFTLGQTVAKHRVPQLVKDLSIALATVQVMEETAGYARTIGGPDVAATNAGAELPVLWDLCRTTYGRQAIQRTV